MCISRSSVRLRTCVSASASMAQVVQHVCTWRSVNIVSVCVCNSFCNILGSAHDVLPLVVLVGVDGNTLKKNRYRQLCKVLWGVDVLVDIGESTFVMLR